MCLVSRAAQITIDDDSGDRMRRVRGRERKRDIVSNDTPNITDFKIIIVEMIITLELTRDG